MAKPRDTEYFQVRLDQIDIARSIDLSPRNFAVYGGRGTVPTEHVARMVDALAAGITLPPIHLCPHTSVIVDGIHRYLAAKHFAGEEWQSTEIAARWDEGCPDPANDPLRFQTRAAQFNGANGLPLNAGERRRLLYRAHQAGDEALAECAAALSMTHAAAVAAIAPMLATMRATVADALETHAVGTGAPAVGHRDEPRDATRQVGPHTWNVPDSRAVRGMQLILAAVADGWHPLPEDERASGLCRRTHEALAVFV